MKKLLAFCALALCAGLADAGEFATEIYGNARGKDFGDLVTDGFIARFPVHTWAIFVQSHAVYMSHSEQAVCHAIVGVVPKGAHIFPLSRFITTRTDTVKPDQWNESEAKAFETACVRTAITNMMKKMDTDPDTVYQPHGC